MDARFVGFGGHQKLCALFAVHLHHDGELIVAGGGFIEDRPGVEGEQVAVVGIHIGLHLEHHATERLFFRLHLPDDRLDHLDLAQLGRGPAVRGLCRHHHGDYVAAIDAGAGLILKVHPSNFTMSGYTAGVPLADLAQLGVPVIMDVGSGLPQRDPRLPNEPDLESCLRDGATIVTASGDKLLGGPQAGLILGDERAVATIRRNPLARALRVDKTTLAALEATLLGPPPPVQQALHVPVAELRRRTEALAARLPVSVPVEVVGAIARVGGGGAPGVELASVALSLPPAYAACLRRGSPALVARVERGRCLVDLRCVPTDLDDLVVDLIAGVEPARLPE